MTEEDMYFSVLTQPAYEGAVTNYRKEQAGIVYGTSDNIAARELLTLQLRSAHARRNNGYASSAVKKYVENMKALEVNWIDKKGKKHTQMQDLWEEFKLDPMLDGYGDFRTFQAIHHGSCFMSGSSFVRKQIRRGNNKNKVPLKLEFIESEFHDIFYSGLSANDNVRNGIKFEDSKPVEYYFQRSRIDTSVRVDSNPYEKITIPASELIHSFIRENPNQWIGIPFLSSVLLPLYELDDLADATVNKQKAAQAISWIIENTNPMNMTPVGAPAIKKDQNNNDKVIFQARGGNVQYLNKGEKLTSIQSSDIGNNLIPFMEVELRRIAAAIGIPYFQLTGDYKGIDFSTLRGIAIELRNRIEYVHHFYTIPLLLRPIATSFKDLANLYIPRTSTAIPVFQMPRWYGVDELKDAQADILEVQNGMATLQSKLDERHTTFEEIAEDRKMIQELGLDNLLMAGGKQMAQANNSQANANSTGNA
jgi:lambda family phage portal protein